jgi:integrase
MAKAAARLTVAKIRALVAKGEPRRHADGGNLYLQVTGPGRALWSFRFMLRGKSREMGLGVADPEGRGGGVTLAEARERAAEAIRLLRGGHDPIERRRDADAEATRERAASRPFRDVAELYISSHEAGWRNAKHRWQWRATLDRYAGPVMGDLAVSEVGTEHVLRVLQPIWTEKPETAARLRGRIECVLDYATARGWRTGENPARWRGHLANLLPARSRVARVVHHAALPWQEVAAFMARLRRHEATAARALEFTILTAARTGEVIGARWSEIDIAGAVWAVPAERMKTHKEHRVPLSSAALAVLRHMAPLRPAEGDGFVFPGLRRGRPLSNMAMLKLLQRMRRGDLTTHGFRSTFRDWCEEVTSTPHAVAEAALAHAILDKVEAAYRRGDLFAKRAALMDEWAEFCAKVPAGVVPPLREAAGA